jgi:hypothetical protein
MKYQSDELGVKISAMNVGRLRIDDLGSSSSSSEWVYIPKLIYRLGGPSSAQLDPAGSSFLFIFPSCSSFLAI